MTNTIHQEFEDTRKLIEEKQEELLKKFQWENFYHIVEKYLSYYYNRYLWLNSDKLLSINEYKYEIMIPELMEFYYLFRTDPTSFHDNKQTQMILRCEFLNVYYSELIYDGETINPYINGDLSGTNYENWDMGVNFTKEWLKFWNENQTKYNLIQILSQS